jgi:hypothetical protein
MPNVYFTDALLPTNVMLLMMRSCGTALSLLLLLFTGRWFVLLLPSSQRIALTPRVYQY